MAEYTLKQIAEQLDVETSTIREWLADSKPPQGRVNGSTKRKFTEEEFTELRKRAILEDVNRLIDDPEVWLDTPNPRMADFRPRELIGSPQEQLLTNVLLELKYGFIS